jgi:hypothetical protein
VTGETATRLRLVMAAKAKHSEVLAIIVRVILIDVI